MKKFLEQKKSAIVSGMSNNKGFSLVELIIVVAIMAVLMGVLAPQYLRFVETSREGTDRSSANEIVKNMTIAISTVENIPVGVVVGWNPNGDLVFGQTGTTLADADILAFAKEVVATLGDNIGSISSTVYKENPPVFAVAQNKTTSVPFVYDISAYDSSSMISASDMYDTTKDASEQSENWKSYSWANNLRIEYVTELAGDATTYNVAGATVGMDVTTLDPYADLG